MSFFAKNLQHVTVRWPEVAAVLQAAGRPAQVEVLDGPQPTLRIAGRQLGSRYDRAAEAQLQASLIPADTPEAWVFGPGLGELPRTLLQRESLRRLHVVLMNPATTAEVLHRSDQCDWLGDPRVDLLTADGIAAVPAPFATVAPELQLVADDGNLPLRDRLLLELDTPFIRERNDEQAVAIRERIQANRELIRADGDVATLFGTAVGAQAVVAGAGPTLSDALSYLAQVRGRGPLVAVDAALRVLLAGGLVPDVVVCIDRSIEGMRPLFQDLPREALAQVPLVYFPGIPTEILQLWPGPRLAAYPEGTRAEELARELPRGRLFSSGSVIHPATDLAVRMGARQVLFAGADFALPHGLSHAGGRKVVMAHIKHWVWSGEGTKVATFPNLRGYLRDLESYIERHPEVRFCSCSAKGARISGAPCLREEGTSA